MKPPARLGLASLALVACTALLAPALAQAATLDVDPAQRCYPEQETLLLPGSGFTPNTRVDFSRNGVPMPVDPPIVADPAGGFSANLTLPELMSGQRRLSYQAIDSASPTNTGEINLLVTATQVRVRPMGGELDRPLTIRARGFFGGKTLWAHVVRRGGKRARNVRIGRIRGACKKARARKQIFPARAAAGDYRVQFDTFRRYRRGRETQDAFSVEISRSGR